MVLAKAERSMNQLKCNIASDFQCLRCNSCRVLLHACPACVYARVLAQRARSLCAPHLLIIDLHPAGKQKSASPSPHSRRSTSATSRPRSSSTIVEREL